jgi:hypothetical protein
MRINNHHVGRLVLWFTQVAGERDIHDSMANAFKSISHELGEAANLDVCEHKHRQCRMYEGSLGNTLGFTDRRREPTTWRCSNCGDLAKLKP